MNSASRLTSPVDESRRIVVLDVLRGVALLGILTLNIGAFSMPAAAYFDPTAHGDLSGLNGWIWRSIHLLADLKFMAIFSMLFGAGIVLASERATTRGLSAAGVHYRRVGWLVVFGLLHAHLLWYGDILYWYGMCGLLVYLFRGLRPRWLIVWGLLAIAVPSAIMLAGGLTADQWPEPVLQSINADLKPSAETKAAEIASYRGGWLEQMDARVPHALDMQTRTFASWALWRVTGLMLLGMALYKLGVLTGDRSRRFYQWMLVPAVTIGLPVIAFGIHRNFANGWESPGYFLIGQQFNYWASLLVSLGWIGAVMLLCKRPENGLTRALAAVGRMAFSNYILQTLVCTWIFYGYGLGLFGQVERTGQLGIVMAVWIGQLLISPLWLKHFRFGPLEWLWRTLVYLRIQPFRRETATDRTA